QHDHRASCSHLSAVQLVIEMAKQALLGRALDPADLPSHLGPDMLVLGPRPLLGLLIPEHLIDDVLGRPHERLDGVDRPDAGHLLLVRLLAFGAAVMWLWAGLWRAVPGVRPFG